MAFTPAFFDFQLQFARCLATRFQLSLPDTLLQYTTFSKVFGRDDWQQYVTQLVDAPDATAWTYQWYLDHCSPDPHPRDTSYLGHPLFGCFYYLVRDTTTIRVHFVKNDPLSSHPLSHERSSARQEEVGRMFAHIHAHVPAAQTVLGNSWLYNLPAYRRLYPPAYTAHVPVSGQAEFQFLAFWGQCFDYASNPKPAIASAILERVAQLSHLDELRWCFPYQILQPTCAITEFYAFYGVV